MTETDVDVEEWATRIEGHRREKDEFLANDPEAPIPEAEQTDFDGLAYFPPDETYRFEARYEPLSNPETVQLGASRGPDLEFEHVGNVGLEIDGDLTVLAVYQSPGVEDLLLPFRDETNGQETWQHGRYLSFEQPGETETVLLDFNLAYHPFCVYAETYVSAIPPMENQLPGSIRAGERL